MFVVEFVPCLIYFSYFLLFFSFLGMQYYLKSNLDLKPEKNQNKKTPSF